LRQLATWIGFGLEETRPMTEGNAMHV